MNKTLKTHFFCLNLAWFLSQLIIDFQIPNNMGWVFIDSTMIVVSIIGLTQNKSQ